MPLWPSGVTQQAGRPAISVARWRLTPLRTAGLARRFLHLRQGKDGFRCVRQTLELVGWSTLYDLTQTKAASVSALTPAEA
jgi:hypothetical protein